MVVTMLASIVAGPVTVVAGTQVRRRIFTVPDEHNRGQLIRAMVRVSATLVGNAANYFKVSVRNKGTAASPTDVEMASFTHSDASVSLAAHTDKALTLSTTPANRKWSPSERVEMQVDHTGSGMAATDLEVEVHIDPNGTYS